MSRAWIADHIQNTTGCTGVKARAAMTSLLDDIVQEIHTGRSFTISSFGSFQLVKLKARKALNPRTGEAVKVKARQRVRFKSSPVLNEQVRQISSRKGAKALPAAKAAAPANAGPARVRGRSKAAAPSTRALTAKAAAPAGKAASRRVSGKQPVLVSARKALSNAKA